MPGQVQVTPQTSAMAIHCMVSLLVQNNSMTKAIHPYTGIAESAMTQVTEIFP
jgi:hypothetical protein